MHRLLGQAVYHGRRVDSEHVEQRRGDVDGVPERAANVATGIDPLGPLDDQWAAHATTMGVLLVTLQGCVAGHRPAPRIVRMALGSAHVVEPLDGFVEVLLDALEELHLVEDAASAALLGSAVVRHDDDDGVVGRADLVEEVDEPANLRIGVLEERGEGFLEPRREPPLALVQRRPRVDAWVAVG